VTLHPNIIKNPSRFSSYDHKCSATFLWFTVYIYIYIHTYIFIPHLCLAAPQEVTSSEFREDLDNHKTRMNGLSCGKESMTICSAVLTQYQRVTDRQTDRRQPIVKTCFSIADARKNRVIFSKNESFIHMAECILLLSQQLVKMFMVCSHTCAKTPTPLVNNYCVVNDSLVHSMTSVHQQTLLSLFMIFN